MPTKVQFQVGSWVTIRPASSSSRDRRDARTPAMITAVNIEGAGSATVVYPNPLVLQHGFKGQGWKRLVDVPFKELRHFTATVNHETQLLRALRVGRSEPRAGTEVEASNVEPQAVSSGKQIDECKLASNLRKWMKPGSVWDSTTAMNLAKPSDIVATEANIKPGLRKWMQPGSVWESDAVTGVLAPSMNALQAAETETDTFAADECIKQHSVADAELSPQEPAAKRAKVHVVAAVAAGPDASEVAGSCALDAESSTAHLRPVAGATDAQSVNEADMNIMESVSSPVPETPEPQPPSPQPSSMLASSLAEDLASTPSPQKQSGNRRTPSPQRLSTDGHIQTFIAAVARAFGSKKKSHLSRSELFDQIFPGGTERNLSTFNLNLAMLDHMDKVAVIDDVVFSLA